MAVGEIETFEAGKGVNCIKLNDNFNKIKNQANANESQIGVLANSSLKKDGSNLTQDIVDRFNRTTQRTIPNASGSISLEDGDEASITLSGDATIVLPAVPQDQYSHTIVAIVIPNGHILNLGTTHHGLTSTVDIEKPYSIMYIYNKLDNNWYYFLGQ